MISGVPSLVESLIGHTDVYMSSKDERSVTFVDWKRSYAVKMNAMVDNETCSDVVFLLKDVERVHANKGLLTGPNENFRAMFRPGMIESKENVVQLGDCSKGVFLLLLEHLYKGKVEVGLDDALELYVMSDRYQEYDLHVQCLEVIRKGLCTSNAIEFLAEADRAGLKAFKDVCMEYVVSHFCKSFTQNRISALSDPVLVELLTNVGGKYF